MINANTSLPRRHLLTSSASALAAVGLTSWTRGAIAQTEATKPLPAYVGWKDPASVIVHSSTTIETKRGAFGTSVITPAEQLYIRNNLPAPDASIIADRDAWEISLDGVKGPRKLTVRELKSMGLETVAMVLQCSGNGRGFSPASPAARPGQWVQPVVWSGAAYRCVRWSRR